MLDGVIPVIFAAFFKAVADTLADHYDTSIFKNLNPKWWHKATSSYHVKYLPFTKYRLDGWHLANTLMISSFLWGVVISQNGNWWGFLIMGVVYNIVFNLFYNKVFR
jgi:hypothetical protein